MHLHQQAGIVVHRLTIIFRVGAVSGTDFMQNAARLAHHVRNTERAADLHQLTARYHHLAAAGDRRQHQQYRRRVVIDDTGVFRTGDTAQEVGERSVAVAASGIIKIVFQRHRRAHRPGNRLNRRFRLNRPAKIGVQHGTGQVKNRTQRALLRQRQPPRRFLHPVIAPARQRLVLTDIFPRLVQHLAQQRHRLGVTILHQQRRECGIAE